MRSSFSALSVVGSPTASHKPERSVACSYDKGEAKPQKREQQGFGLHCRPHNPCSRPEEAKNLAGKKVPRLIQIR